MPRFNNHLPAAMAVVAGAAALGAVAVHQADAHPEGAPWRHTGGPGRADCSACHFGGEPSYMSDALSLFGLPDSVEPNASYALTLRLASEDMANAGFMILAESEDGAPVGVFTSTDERIETNGAMARSTLLGSSLLDAGSAEWRLDWLAPSTIPSQIILYASANAGNDDRSPFGDDIHVNQFTIGADLD